MDDAFRYHRSGYYADICIVFLFSTVDCSIFSERHV